VAAGRILRDTWTMDRHPVESRVAPCTDCRVIPAVAVASYGDDDEEHRDSSDDEDDDKDNHQSAMVAVDPRNQSCPRNCLDKTDNADRIHRDRDRRHLLPKRTTVDAVESSWPWRHWVSLVAIDGINAPNQTRFPSRAEAAAAAAAAVATRLIGRIVEHCCCSLVLHLACVQWDSQRPRSHPLRVAHSSANSWHSEHCGEVDSVDSPVAP
jgi:hypothetical protein